ncbi:uncharacterized protein N7473_000087 [Penicillium subrubescens]|uniref:uncharacterized protein n=1 Tax=Penicillium subrubescens TaxID=1316194 RepID=UPI0025452561|nr:uncharacterized protein N7473_000087 [Penicillium subrubescens]KAJ5910784.1 hypothetical protein N7473_000087 [Penicillium subrubescens]
MDDFFSLYGDESNYSIEPRGLAVTHDGVAIGVHATGLFARTPEITSLLAGNPGNPSEDWGQSYSGCGFSYMHR